MGQGIEQKPRGLPIAHELLLAFLASSLMIIAALGTVYYLLATSVMSSAVHAQTLRTLEDAVSHFDQLYSYTPAGDLTLPETMPALNSFLTGRPYEQRIYRQSIERQFLQV